MYALAQDLEAQFLSTCIMGSACCDYQLRYTRVDVVFIGYRVILIFFPAARRLPILPAPV